MLGFGSSSFGRTHLLTAALSVLAVSGATAHAETLDLPAGWTLTAPDLSGYLLALSPERPGEVPVTVLLPPSETLESSLSDAFTEDVPALLASLYGDLLSAPETVPLAGLAQSPVAVSAQMMLSLDEGATAGIEATAYRVGSRYQLILIAAPGELPRDDAAMAEARTLAEDLRARQFVLTDSRLSGIVAMLGSGAGGDPARPPTLRNEAVEDVIVYLRYAIDRGASEPQTTTAVLLEDGRAYEGVAEAPSAFDHTTRPIGTPGTGRWRRDGDGYLLTFADGAQGTAVAKATKTSPAEPGARIEGRYRFDGGALVAPLADEVTFNADGSLLSGSTSARYALDRRTITLTTTASQSGGTSAYLFGWQGEDASKPTTLVIGTAVFERVD